MKKFKFLFLVFTMCLVTPMFSQNGNSLKVEMLPQAADISYYKMDLRSVVKSKNPSGNSFVVSVYYLKGNNEVVLVQVSEPTIVSEKQANRLSEVLIRRIKNDQSLIIEGTDYNYIFTN